MRIYENEQSGRSMVEMLGVLAIVGVLTVAGIAGYSKAMGKYKTNKTADQVATLTSNIRTLFAGQKDYSALTTASAITYGLVPPEMVNVDGVTINNAFAGTVEMKAATINGLANAGFSLTFNGLNKDSCISLAASDWGGASSGLNSMGVSPTTGATADMFPVTKLPLSLTDIGSSCECTTAGNTCSIAWVYF